MPSEAVSWEPLWTSLMPDSVWSRLDRVSSWTGIQVSERWVKGSMGMALEVAGLDEVVERLGGFLLVDGVGVDGLAQDVEVFLEDGLVGVADVAGVGGDGDGGEQADDDHDDHELEEGEARRGAASAGKTGLGGRGRCSTTSAGKSALPGLLLRMGDVYHVEYFVPSRAVPVLLVWTSKTFWPPKESESASSWLERRPQSVVPVMGSMGMRRRNLTFLVLDRRRR